MTKKSLFGLVVCLLAIAGSAWAQTIPVLDTGDPAERICIPKSYTKIGSNIVRDNVTGLMWQIQSEHWGYSWQQAMDYCNNLTLGGYSDWRLPTIEELSTLIDSGHYNPAIDVSFFPNMKSKPPEAILFYWSSSNYPTSSEYAFIVAFIDGDMNFSLKTNNYLGMRAVRGEPYGQVGNFVVNGDGTVTDPYTGLMWQQCTYGQTWNGGKCVELSESLTWQQAFDTVEILNNSNYLDYNDWRMPTRNELQSILEYLYNDQEVFRDSAGQYWTSTSLAPGFSCVYGTGSSCAWTVFLPYGVVLGEYKLEDYFLRVVRGGSCAPRGPGRIDKCTVKAGKIDGADSIQLSGSLNAIEADFIAEMGGDVVVTLEADYIPDPNETTFTFPIDEEYLNSGKYASPQVKPLNKTDPVESFALDTIKGTMKFSAKNVDLTGLSCPITVTVQIGDYVAVIELGEDIVNGTKPCPLPLMMGVKNSLDVLKFTAKKGASDGTDSVSISGTFTIDGSFDTGQPVEITLGPDTFSIPGAQFLLSKGVYSRKSFDTGDGLVTAKFDTVKCTYSIQIKGADISGNGNVVYGLNVFGNVLNAVDPIPLPPEF